MGIQQTKENKSAQQIDQKSAITVDFKAHIAIDFGTDGCALAFVSDAKPGKVEVYNKWKTKSRRRVVKAKTYILLNDKNEVVAFGNSAKSIFSNFTGIEKKNWKFFERFKMSLYGDDFNHKKQDNLVSNNTPSQKVENESAWSGFSGFTGGNDHKYELYEDELEAMNGQKCPARIVFVAALKEIEDIATEYLYKIAEKEYDKNDIQWIITVPAIWSEQAKQKMKGWAIEAGLVTATIENHCKIVYEPDCAAMAIYKEIEHKNKNNAYMIIDAGGGTVDITCHEIMEDGTVEEIHYPTGGKWGGCYIDDKYIKLLKCMFTDQCIDDYKMEEPNVYIEIIDNFNKAKSTFYEDSKEEMHSVELPYEFIQYLHRKCKQQRTTLQGKIREFGAKTLHFYHELLNDKKGNESNALMLENESKFKNGLKTIDLYKPGDEVQYKSYSEHDKTNDLMQSHVYTATIIKIYKERKHILFKDSKGFCHLVKDLNKIKIKYDEKLSDDVGGNHICILKLVSDDEGDYFEMDVNIWKCLFDSTINEIVQHVDNLINTGELKNKLNYLCLVGGFSASLYFQERMEQAFGSQSEYKLQLKIPQNPTLSVVQGAAWMGITNNYIKARKLKYTYGISGFCNKDTANRFGISDEYIKNNTTKDGRVEKCFKIIAHKNERIAVNEKKTNTSYRTSKTSLIPILYSDKQQPNIASDGHELAVLKVPHFDSNVEIITEFHFGGTTFRVYSYAKNNPDGKKEVDLKYVK